MGLTLRAGARDSLLSVAQSNQSIRSIQQQLPWLTIDLVPMTSPGDEDRKTDLRESPADFFTRYLDDAVRSGDIDVAIHSAKDLPDPVPDDLDWFWLPWRADPRDAVILRVGETMADLPEKPVVGVSSDRRDEWAAKHVPNAIFRPIRGNIEHRLQQVDDGDFDILLMASCALHRLDMSERITSYIPLSELDAPEGQGSIAVTFKKGNEQLEKIRRALIPAVVLAGAGPGMADYCTTAAVEALRNCDVCLYDALVDPRLLRMLPPHAKAIDAGKRGGSYSLPREQLDGALQDYSRQGRRIVRLKGGDPGIFGRLPQEIAALDAFALPYRVLPGMSCLNAASTGTGLLLTQRGESRGFTVTTPVLAKGAPGPVTARERADHPLVFFMAVTRIAGIAEQLRADGRPADEPAALVLGAGTDNTEVIRGTLPELAESATPERVAGRPGLLIVGDVADEDHALTVRNGLLAGRRILLTCSDAVLEQTSRRILEYAGEPIAHPLIELRAESAAVPALERMAEFDWLILTSPAAARCLLELMREHQIDVRKLPKILTCGPGAERVLNQAAITIDARPQENFGADSMIALAKDVLKPGERVLRLRSDRAPATVAETLTAHGCSVEDVILYRNVAIDNPPEPPPYDAIFFASASAVDAYVAAYGSEYLQSVDVLAIGRPTAARLATVGIDNPIVGHEASPVAAAESLAAHVLQQQLNG